MLIFFYFAISGIIYMRSLRNDLDTYVMPRTVTTEQADQLREYLSGYEAHAVTVKINSLMLRPRNMVGSYLMHLKRQIGK